ncbi:MULTISPECIES: ABC transporter ATP-binding protein [unclassified Psychrobacter]|uniref:ABC transporter ATP-binding protein n=1 Tax=unclassified Psychrobacter TaxID=196806 RepID=UPI000C3426BA|nr:MULTISPECIES: ABC transporter ATP-binding protein [unclassified Psychrobacter]MBA6244955.1 ABC transporter ATP-binding protein [Psychrobacter sp. Urea-trap-18]MBA6286500.1 ABC transporter ATP-binding protein [Psychrobacter sp. Urea-trap-16]MBA6318511.1 ABC transporter ATP-binding protein [Psychrobacter sp. Urea-trap-20]MBA6334732.1 ABC transporter ATP-binding protein [Psychrobacter sp. Urea-trap-19]PKG61367.1 multidrug ABC transporter ATP-binding protein [Psychrobacter sp. Choline-3u-12]
MNALFRFFENRLPAFPDTPMPLPSPRDGMLKFLWACTNGLRGWLLIFMILSAGIGIYEAMLFAWIGNIVDWLGVYTPQNLWVEKGDMLLIMLAVMIVSPLWIALSSFIHFQTLQGVFPMQMRWRFHQRMLGQSMQFYQDEFSGRVSAKVMQTALAVRDTVMTVTDMFMYVSVYFITSGVILFNLDSLLLIPFVIWLVLVAITIWYFIPKLKQTAIVQADARALMTGRITDAYANIMTVKLFSHSRRELGYAKNAMGQFLGTVHAQMRWVSYLEVSTHLISVILVSSTAGIGLYLWQQGAVGVGAIAAATAMALRLNGLTRWIMWQTASLFESIGTVQDGMRTLSAPQTIIDKPDAPALAVTDGRIVFDHVDFSYENDEEDNGQTGETVGSTSIAKRAPNSYIKLLDNFHLDIKPGEKIGLVGRSGAGKSTLVNLLLRFFDVDSGNILIDGQAIDEVTQESLRQQIGMVTQDTSLLHRTVRENIAYGRPDATDEEIMIAAKQAQAWDFIKDLYDDKGNTGLDTQVGERGVKLSGGQRQRIAISRVMLKNAPILLLDEATSALDSEIEYAITESLNHIMTGKTVIAIAHRLSTIAALDRLVVMHQGSIIEQGSHDELLALNGVYARLWQRQSGGFLGEDN